jgi:hypothetical protein
MADTATALAKLTSGQKLTDEEKKLLGLSTSNLGGINPDPLAQESDNTKTPSMTTWIVNLLKNVPELRNIYDAVRYPDGSFNTTANAIVDMITASSWYLKNGPTVAANIAGRYKYGESYYNQKVNEYKITLSGIATAIGLDANDPAIGDYLESLAETSFLNGWDESYMENQIISNASITSKINGGAYAGQVEDLAEYGNLMGFTLSDITMKDYQRRLIGQVTTDGLRTRSTPDQIKKEIRDKQALLYPMFADDFAVGRTLWDVTALHRKKWSDLLEVDEDTLDWNTDPLWKDGKIFTAVDEKTGRIGVRPVWDAEKLIKQTEDWQYTENATRLYDNWGARILDKMGMVAI